VQTGSLEGGRASQDVPQKAPRKTEEDPRRFLTAPRNFKEVTEGPKRLPGKHPAKNKVICLVPHRMAHRFHFWNTYEAKSSFPSLRCAAAHVNAHSTMKSGFRIGWLIETKKEHLWCEMLVSFIEA
jgi:hypothetical protein